RWVFSSTFTRVLAVLLTLGYILVLFVGKQWVPQPPTTEFTRPGSQLGQIIVAVALIFEAVVVLTAAAVAISTRLGQVMTLMVCLGVFAIGLISGSLDQLVEQQLGLATSMGPAGTFDAIFTSDAGFGLKLVYALLEVLYLVLPNLQLFWPADAITLGNSLIYTPEGGLSLVYLASTAAYGLLYIAAVLAIAIALFHRREVG
ncbi:MAG: hypothetical protein ACOC1G_05065, partial [Phycisphaeraceae bacterium]